MDESPTNPLIVLLTRANRRRDHRVSLHPSRWPALVAAMLAAGGEWDLRIRVSPNCSPAAIYLYLDGSPTPSPIDRVNFAAPAEDE